ncbi:PAS domain S-box protein, partial [Brasilonema bromeliae]|uniref:PAS domain S-box protein n=1 Tax=Brasilonema bromeliae TaxID=383615 RepID=UPI001FE8C2C4
MEAEVTERKQTEIALRESEERSRALIENLPGGAMFVVDRNLRYLVAEGEALSAAGFKPEDLVGRTIFEVLPPELAAYYEGLYRRGLAGEPFEHEHKAHNRSFISRGTPLRSTDGEVYAVLAVSYDISECKRVEDERALAEAAIASDLQDTQLLRDLSARLTTEADIQVLYDEIMATAIALMRADAGSMQFLDETTQELVLIATQGFSQAMTDDCQRLNASSNTSCGRALAAGERTFIDFDVPDTDDPDGSLRLLINAGYFSGQSTPLISRSGNLIGMVSTHWRRHHRPSDRELRFLDLLVRQAADLIEQRQAAAALRESEEKYRTLVSATSKMVWTADAKGNIIAEVPGWEQFTGQTFDEYKNFGWLAVLHPDDVEQTRQIWQTAIAHHTTAIAEYRLRTMAGDYRRVAVRGEPLLNADGNLRGWVGTITDIEDMRRTTEAEQAALHQLRESEEKYRTLFDSIDEGFSLLEIIYNQQGAAIDVRYRDTNRAFERHTGIKDAEGKTLRELIPNIESSYWINTWNRVARTGEPERLENYVQETDHWFNVYTSRIGGEGSNMVAVVFNDITERKRTETNLAFLAEVSQDLTRLTNIDETMDAIGAKIGGHFNVVRVVFAEISEDQQTGRVSHEWHQPDLPDMKGSYATKDYFSPELELLHRAGEIAVVRDTAKDEQIDGERYAALGVGAFVGVPLIRQDKWRFYFSLLDSKPHDWRDDEIELLRELTTRIWTRLERARAEEDLAQSEEKYRTLFDSIDEGFVLFELIYDENEQVVDHRYLEVNQVFERQTGLENAAGKLASEIAYVEPCWLETYDRVVQTGEPVRFENYSQATGRWYATYASRVGKAGSRQVIAIFDDITDRKRAEEAMRVFFSNVSHEFRTPLTLLLSSIQETSNDPAHPLSSAQRS